MVEEFFQLKNFFQLEVEIFQQKDFFRLGEELQLVVEFFQQKAKDSVLSLDSFVQELETTREKVIERNSL